MTNTVNRSTSIQAPWMLIVGVIGILLLAAPASGEGPQIGARCALNSDGSCQNEGEPSMWPGDNCYCTNTPVGCDRKCECLPKSLEDCEKIGCDGFNETHRYCTKCTAGNQCISNSECLVNQLCVDGQCTTPE